MTGEAGKGSAPRPMSVPREEYDRNFDNIKWGTLEESIKQDMLDDFDKHKQEKNDEQ